MKPLLAILGLALAAVQAQTQTWVEDSLVLESIRNANPTADPEAILFFREGAAGRVVELKLYGPEITSIPSEAGRLQALRTLGCIGCRLDSLPASLVSLALLESLDLSSTRLSSLPDWLADLPRLQKLNLYQANLRSLPDAIVADTALSLGLEGNRLCDLPASTAALLDRPGKTLGWRRNQDCPLLPADSLDALTLLSLHGLKRPLRQFLILEPDTLAMRPLVTGIRLYNRDTVSSFVLPAHLGLARKLKYLEFSNGSLTSLDMDFKSMTSLVDLHLSGNRLTALPDSFFALPALRHLSLAGNQLTRLPPGIGASTVRTLQLANNRLESLPAEITVLDLPDDCPPYIQRYPMGPFEWSPCLVLEGNRLCDLPPDIEAWADEHDTVWRAKQDCGVATRPGVLKESILEVTHSPSGFAVAWRGAGHAEILVHTLDGTLVGRGVASSLRDWGFRGLKPGVYLVSARAGGSRAARRFVIP